MNIYADPDYWKTNFPLNQFRGFNGHVILCNCLNVIAFHAMRLIADMEEKDKNLSEFKKNLSDKLAEVHKLLESDTELSTDL